MNESEVIAYKFERLHHIIEKVLPIKRSEDIKPYLDETVNILESIYSEHFIATGRVLDLSLFSKVDLDSYFKLIDPKSTSLQDFQYKYLKSTSLTDKMKDVKQRTNEIERAEKSETLNKYKYYIETELFLRLFDKWLSYILDPTIHKELPDKQTIINEVLSLDFVHTNKKLKKYLFAKFEEL